MLRKLEGELVIYGGVGHLVKGYQHPGGFLVAYPRYDLFARRKIGRAELERYSRKLYWDCIKKEVAAVPLDGAVKLYRAPSNVYEVSESIAQLLDVDPGLIEVSGSSLLLDEPRDIDIIIYGSDESVVVRIKKLLEAGIFQRTGEYTLFLEYREKHSGALSLWDYLELKRDTILHVFYRGLHVNLKLYMYKEGVNACVDRVEDVRSYDGVIEVIKSINPRLLPARYYVLDSKGSRIVAESFRELYAELRPGKYVVVNGRLEIRSSGEVLNFDEGKVSAIK